MSKKEIAASEDISPAYLEQILTALRSAGLVRSHRGVGGGFTMSGEHSRLSVATILEATEGPLAIVPCVGANGRCKRSASCVAGGVWQKANDALLKVLKGITIRDMVRESETRRHDGELMFEI